MKKFTIKYQTIILTIIVLCGTITWFWKNKIYNVSLIIVQLVGIYLLFRYIWLKSK